MASEWDAATALANLEAAVTANPQIDMMFTSSTFLFPTIRSVLEPRGMWKKAGRTANPAGGWTATQRPASDQDGYVSATGVQDLYFERNGADRHPRRRWRGNAQPNELIADPGFARPRRTSEREDGHVGCVLLAEGFLDK